MRKQTNVIVIHCSATKPSQNIGVAEIKKWHIANGWIDIGYHWVIRRNGVLEQGRNEEVAGAHVAGHNSNSVGVCLVGGVNEQGKADNNFTNEQFMTLKWVVHYLLARYPGAKIVGHRDLSPDLNNDGKITSNEFIKECPSFDAVKWAKDNI